MSVQIPRTSLPFQLPADTPGKAAGDGPSARALLPTREAWTEFLALDFDMAQPQLLPTAATPAAPAYRKSLSIQSLSLLLGLSSKNK